MADTFDIVKQTPRTAVQPGGGIAPVIDVTFTAKPSGQTGVVTIPQSTYNADEVRRVVGAAAAQLNAIQAL